MRKTKAAVFVNFARSCQLFNDSSFHCKTGNKVMPVRWPC